MIFNDKFLFLHFPKTGGMMLTSQLIKNLKSPIYYSLPKGHLSPKEKILKYLRRIRVLEGLRHENTKEAEQLIVQHTDKKNISEFELILVIVRNPYDYMVSRFHYLKYIQKHNKEGRSMKLAREGDFSNFVLNQPEEYNPEFFIKDHEGNLLPNMKIVKYENLKQELNSLLSPYLKRPLRFDKKINATKQSFPSNYILEKEVEKTIYLRHRCLFDLGLYQRIKV